jgi:glycosyltransferase involved in cell wall biosynthesis
MLEDFKNTDSRIKIVNNEKNCGLCYSRAMGLLNSTGEYIMFLEPDDLFEGKDNLEYLYNQYKNTKEDLIIYNYYNVNRKMKRTRCEKYDKTLTQPEIFEIAFSNYKVHDELIWNKIIKRKLLLKICKLLKKFIMGEKWNHHEDHVWSLLSHKLAKSMRCVDKIAYIYEKNEQSLSKNTGTIIELNNILKRHEAYEIIFDKNTEKYFFSSINDFITRIKNNNYFVNLLKTDEDLKLRAIKILSDFISRYEDKTLNIKRITSFLDSII